MLAFPGYLVLDFSKRIVSTADLLVEVPRLLDGIVVIEGHLVLQKVRVRIRVRVSCSPISF